MDISLGFVVVLTLILFPGLIFRRLYFYGEFSKQFNSGNNILVVIALATIPGIVILTSTYWFYDSFFTKINLGEIIDKFKDINSSDFRFEQEKVTDLETLISKKAAPFLGFLYLISIIFGFISGRFIRISRIDTKFKLLRFKNYWFYLFNGQHTGFKKMKHLKEKNKKHLFTKADILIDSNSKTLLYSGIVVDYELDSNDSTILSKVMLENAERYSLREGQRVPVQIPGQILVVDCSTIKNINLTYISEESKDILTSKIPNNIEVIFGLIIILLIPVFIFKIDSIDWSFYKSYFNLTWYAKLLVFLLTAQCLSLMNPFVKEKEEYKWVNSISILAKTLWIGGMIALLWLIA